MSGFKELFSSHAGAVYAKQLAFADYLGERRWNLDTQTGIASFGDDLRFSVQVLGTHSESDNSWQWAWANEESDLPHEIVSTSLEMKGYGQLNSVPELSTGHFGLEFDSEQLAMVCSGMTDCCYYRGPYEGGSVYFLVLNTPDELIQQYPLEKVMIVDGLISAIIVQKSCEVS